MGGLAPALLRLGADEISARFREEGIPLDAGKTETNDKSVVIMKIIIVIISILIVLNKWITIQRLQPVDSLGPMYNLCSTVSKKRICHACNPR